MPTLICVPVMVEEVHTALSAADDAKAAGADLVEFRIDPFFTGTGGRDEEDAVVRLVSGAPLPCIVTCRTAAEGGEYRGDDEALASLLERIGTAHGAKEHPPRFIDVEHARLARSEALRAAIDRMLSAEVPPGLSRPSVILSMHDPTGRPRDLTRRILAMRESPDASILKIAYHARSLRDNLELFDLLAENAAGKPMIALGMGEFGLMSRVLAPKFGGFLTFAALRPQATTAPGQPTIRDLTERYRFRSIGRGTRVYGVVGWPVGHSLSPAIHNAAFAALRHDGVYLPLPVPTEYEHFKATVGLLIDDPRLDFAGCSVTVPHKEHLVRFARERAAAPSATWSLDELSSACGAANTLAVDRGPDGTPTACRVLNTDGPAAVERLAGLLGTVEGKRIAVLGAGGAARSIAAALVIAGAHVTVHNRTRERAERLVGDLRGALRAARGTIDIGAWDDIAGPRPGAVVNCTTIGLPGGPAPDASPIPFDALQNLPPSAAVLDSVYDPSRAETPLLAQARSAGFRTIDGLELLAAQAARQVEAWTGKPPPQGLPERAARSAAGATTG